MKNNFMSKNAKKIYNLLNKIELKVTTEYSFDDLIGLGGGLLRFDFAIFDNNRNLIGLIEYDGEFHDKELNPDEYDHFVLSTHDKMKSMYCNKNEIPLLRIHHTEFENYIKLIIDFLKSINVKVNALKLTSNKLTERKNEILKQIKDCDEDDERIDELLQELHEIMYELKNIKSIWKGGNTRFVKGFVTEINDLIENSNLKMEELGLLLYIASKFTTYEDNYLRFGDKLINKAELAQLLSDATSSKLNSSFSYYKKAIIRLEKDGHLLTEINPNDKRNKYMYINPKIFYKGRFIDKVVKELI